MSPWEPDSDLSRFNRRPPDTWQTLPPEFATVIDSAIRIARESGGAYDPTMGALIDLWGFGPADRDRPHRRRTPSPWRLTACGWRHLDFDAATQPPAPASCGTARSVRHRQGFRGRSVMEDAARARHPSRAGGDRRRIVGRGVKPDGSPSGWGGDDAPAAISSATPRGAGGAARWRSQPRAPSALRQRHGLFLPYARPAQRPADRQRHGPRPPCCTAPAWKPTPMRRPLMVKGPDAAIDFARRHPPRRADPLPARRRGRHRRTHHAGPRRHAGVRVGPESRVLDECNTKMSCSAKAGHPVIPCQIGCSLAMARVTGSSAFATMTASFPVSFRRQVCGPLAQEVVVERSQRDHRGMLG